MWSATLWLLRRFSGRIVVINCVDDFFEGVAVVVGVAFVIDSFPDDALVGCMIADADNCVAMVGVASFADFLWSLVLGLHGRGLSFRTGRHRVPLLPDVSS